LFPSGARLTKPAPNHSDTSGVFVFDKTSGFGFTATDIAPYIPDGTAYLVEGSNPPFPLTFTFPEPQLMVGAFVTEPLTISAYNKNGALLGYESISAADVYKWKSSFLGIKVIGDGIASVTFSGNAKQINGLRLDMLTFETVPEPSTIALLLTACIGSLLWWRRR
jgi:hypothetical protein